MARKRLGSISNLVFLGNGVYHDPTGLGQIVHLPILSFLVQAPPDLGGFLHYNFVCTLLNDLVGSLLLYIKCFSSFKRLKNDVKGWSPSPSKREKEEERGRERVNVLSKILVKMEMFNTFTLEPFSTGNLRRT